VSPLEQLVKPKLIERKLTQAALARQTGMSRSALSHMLNGGRRLTVAVALRLAEALELDAKQLLAAAPRRFVWARGGK
jgi:transcriptional regulator with XRE-family HTH domain